jgi:DNA-binding LacI/PurR family transcriptional regulator
MYAIGARAGLMLFESLNGIVEEQVVLLIPELVMRVSAL